MRATGYRGRGRVSATEDHHSNLLISMQMSQNYWRGEGVAAEGPRDAERGKGAAR